MSKFYIITLTSTEINQLLKIFDTKTVMSDKSSIILLSKIQKALPIDVSINRSSEPELPSDPDLYPIEFQPSELQKLLDIIYLQNAIDDDQAINLIAKIHREVHSSSILKKKNLLINQDLDQSLVNAQETYYQYREKWFALGLKSTLPDLNISTDVAPHHDTFPNDTQHQDLLTPLMTIVQTLESIAHTLESIVIHLPPAPPQTLGFTTNYRRQTIYCEARHGTYWHLRNEYQQLIPIHGRALTCILQTLSTIETADAELKVHLHVQADKLYCLEFPFKSLLTTTLLNSIAQLSPQQLQLPITIEPVEDPGLEELTCNVYYQGSSLLEAPEIPQPLPILIKQVQGKLQQISVNGR